MTLYSSSGGGSGGYNSPTNITALHRQSLNNEIIVAANPWLAEDLDTLNALSSSGADPEMLAHNAGALAGVDAVDRLQGSLERLNPVAARSVYGRLTEQQQRALQTMGYAPPQRTDNDGFLDNTFLEGTFDIAANVVSAVARPVGTLVAPVAGFAMDTLTWIGDVPAHFYRAIRQMDGWQQWLALAAAAGAVALTGGLALGAIGAGTMLGGAAAGMMGGAGMMGTLTTLGALGGTALGAGVLSTLPTAIQNPTEWWDMMNPLGATGVTRGERIFSQDSQVKARSILGNAEHLNAMARDIAAELDVQDLAFDMAGKREATSINVMMSGIEATARKMAEPGTQEYERIYAGLNELVMQEEFQLAIDSLAAGKISFGRDIASAFQLQPGDTGYGFVSGAADGLWLLAMDPTMALGKIGKLQRMTRRGIESPSGPDAIRTITRMFREDTMVATTVKQVSDAIQDGNFSQMPRAWRGMFQPLMEYKHGEYLQHGLPKLEEFTPEDFLKFVAHGDGLKRITEGKATIRGIEQIVVSTHNSSKGWGKFVHELKHAKYGLGDAVMVDEVKQAAKRHGVADEYNKVLPQDVMQEGVDTGFVIRKIEDGPINETWGYKAGSAVGDGLLYIPGGRSLGNFITGITTMIPPQSAIALTGDDAADQIPRFVESMGSHFNMPSGYRQEWLDTIMRQGTVGQRRQAMYSYMDSLFTAGGMKSSDELAGFAEEFMGKYKQAYGFGGADHIKVGNLDRIAGLLPQHHNAVFMVMPDLRVMSKVVRDGHFLKNVARVTDHSFHEQAMARVVKPSWLMRIGFIPRAAGEEMLAFWMRMSEGGLVQEFHGRTVGKRNAHRAAVKRLDEVGGAMEKLTRDELIALDPSSWLPHHMRPLVKMKERYGWLDPDTGLLSDWIDTTTRWRSDGIMPSLLRQDRESLPKWLTENDWRRALVTGRTGSMREMALMGVDPDYIRAGELWVNKHADAIMRSTSSMNAGMMEKQIVNPDSTTMMLPDPKNPGKKKETLVVMTGERGRVTAGDQRYRNAVHHRVGEVFQDDVVRPIYSKAVTDYFPGFNGEIDLNNVGDLLERLTIADNYSTQMLVGEFLQPSAATWQAAATHMSRTQPELGEVMRIAAQATEGNVTPESFRTSLQEAIRRYETVDDIDPAVIGHLSSIDTKLTQMDDVLRGMDALAPDARAWMSAVASRQMASEFTAYDLKAVRRQASGDDWNSAPELIYYRGFRDSDHLRKNADGSITVLATSQQQWGDNVANVSMTLDPGHAMRFSTLRSGGWENRPDLGGVLEINGDWMNNQFNTTLDEIRNAPRNFGTSEHAFKGDGLHLIGDDSQGFTEIALALDATNGPREFTIPAGQWRFQTTDDQRYISEALAANPEDSRFAGVAASMIYDVAGEPVAEVFPKASAKIDEFIESLSDEERAWLNELFTDQYETAKAFERGKYDDVPPPRYEAILSLDEMPTGSGDFSDNLIMKWRKLIDDPLQGDATAGDAFRMLIADQGEVGDAFMVDDMIRERLGYPLLADLDSSLGGSVFELGEGQAVGNRMLVDMYSDRGTGGWGDMEEIEGWAPFTTDLNQMIKKMQNDLAAALIRPENTQYVKRADRILQGKDGKDVARPVADGEARIYTPIIPSDSKHIDELLDGMDVDVNVEDLAVIRGVEQAMAVGKQQMPGLNNWEITGDEYAVVHIRGLIADDIGPLKDISPERRQAAWALDQHGIKEIPVLDADGKVVRYTYGPTDQFKKYWDEYYATFATSQTLDQRAIDLLSRRRAWTYDDDLIRSLSDEDKQALIKRALRYYDASRAKYANPVPLSMSELAFDDPRIAKWISSVFSDTADQVNRVGMVAVPRLALGGDMSNKFGVELAEEFATAGRRWNLDSRYEGQTHALDAELFQTMDTGEIVPGMSQAQAIKDWADEIVDSIVMNHRRGVREAQVYNPKTEDTRLGRRVGDTYEPLNPGERVEAQEDLFRIDPDDNVGAMVGHGDNAFFDHVITEMSDDLMFATIGPMLRDVFEAEAGLTRIIPNEFKEGGKFWSKTKAHETQIPENFINQKRSRVSDLNLEPSEALPNVAITENFKRTPNTVWDRIVRYGFDSVIGPAIDVLARKPMSFHYFASAYKQQMKHLSWQLDDVLFNVNIPEAFGDVISLSRSEGNIDSHLEAARLVSKNFGVDLTDAGANDVKRWISTLGRDQDEFETAMDLAIQGRKNHMSMGKNAQTITDPKEDLAFIAAAEELKNVNRRALQLSIVDETVGSRTDAERLVQAYHDAVPDQIWGGGRDAVLNHVRKHVDGLPYELTSKQWEVLLAGRTNMKHITEQAHNVAAMRAMENVIPFLDSHEQRTMFAEYGRNFLPFWYAEENFIKRWARTLSLGEFATPFGRTIPSGGLDTMRKAQVTYMGIKSAGIIRTDANGHDWVVYPGSGLLQEAVDKILPGNLLPVGVLFQAETDSLLPGVTPDGNISPAPLIGAPVKFVGALFREADQDQDMARAILGDIGASKGYFSQFVPSVFANLYEAMQDENKSAKFASAMNAAIAFLEASDNGLADGASAATIDEYLGRVRNHARIILVSQAIAGYVVPGSPNALVSGDTSMSANLGLDVIDPREITNEVYRGYIRNLGMDKGVEAFLAAFPNADLEDMVVDPLAYSTSGSTAPSAAPLTATSMGVDWYHRNKDWVDASPEAGAWLIPQPEVPEGGNEFNRNAYAEQLKSGLRKRRTPQEYIEAISYRSGAAEYFGVKDQHDAAVLRAGSDRAEKARVDDIFDLWKTNFLAANPLFAEQLANGDARMRRDRTVEQMRYAVNDPEAPDSPYTDEIRKLAHSYDSFAVQRKLLGDRNDAKSRQELRDLKERFSNWGTAWSLKNRDLQRLWDSVYRIEAGIA